MDVKFPGILIERKPSGVATTPSVPLSLSLADIALIFSRSSIHYHIINGVLKSLKNTKA